MGNGGGSISLRQNCYTPFFLVVLFTPFRTPGCLSLSQDRSSNSFSSFSFPIKISMRFLHTTWCYFFLLLIPAGGDGGWGGAFICAILFLLLSDTVAPLCSLCVLPNNIPNCPRHFPSFPLFTRGYN